MTMDRVEAMFGGKIQPAASVSCLSQCQTLLGKRLKRWGSTGSWSPATVSGGGGGGGGGGGAGEAHGSRDTLDVRYSMAVLADDYTKRKHVLRLTTAGGAELLLQADSAPDAARWLRSLKRHSAAAPDAHAHDARQLSPLPPHRTKKIGRNRSPTGPPTPTLPSSPKSKTWKGRMARQLRRMHGGGASAPAATGWLGAPLERCPADPARPGVPLAVTLCAAAVEAAGLRTVGVYRVPGNSAGVAALAAALDRGEPPPPQDPRWADVHVASSLLKNYLRKLPDSLLTAELYPAFIAAERAAPPPERARQLRRLVRALPDAHYETLRFLTEHLRRVVAHADCNKMEARNLAIVFGPTLVRGADDDMLAMVNDMSSQCRIIESLINHYEWYFDEEESGSPVEPPGEEELAPSAGSRALLIHNVKKIEGKDVTPRDIMSSIISAANRKMQRKPRSKPSPASAEPNKKWSEPRDKSPATPPASPPASPPHHLTTSLAHYDGLEGAAPARVSCSAINQSTQERIKKFEQETIAMLQRPYSARSGGGAADATRAAAADLVSKELAAIAGKRHRAHDVPPFTIDGTGDLVSSLTSTFDQKLRTLNNSSPLEDHNIPYADDDDGKLSSAGSRGSGGGPGSGSEERVSPAARAHQLKTAWLSRDHRLSSSSSTDDTDNSCSAPAPDAARPDSAARKPGERADADATSRNSSEPLTDDDKSVELPAAPAPAPRVAPRMSNPECVKRNSAVLENDIEPDTSNKENGGDGVKLKRSESLNRSPERNPARVLRSESLNCRDTRLQRSDSLNKAERLSKVDKNERRRDPAAWRSTKLKRKNGMPERGIKRRHTVGGTKDFDKDGWSSRHTRTSSPDLTHVCLAPAPLVPPPRPPLESHV